MSFKQLIVSSAVGIKRQTQRLACNCRISRECYLHSISQVASKGTWRAQGNILSQRNIVTGVTVSLIAGLKSSVFAWYMICSDMWHVRTFAHAHRIPQIQQQLSRRHDTDEHIDAVPSILLPPTSLKWCQKKKRTTKNSLGLASQQLIKTASCCENAERSQERDVIDACANGDDNFQFSTPT